MSSLLVSRLACTNLKHLLNMSTARGTGEPGPFGCIVGDPLVAAVTKALPGSRAAAVQYPASFNLTYSPQIGMDAAINRLNSQSKECPDQTFVAIGYSQGANYSIEISR